MYFVFLAICPARNIVVRCGMWRVRCGMLRVRCDTTMVCGMSVVSCRDIESKAGDADSSYADRRGGTPGHAPA